MGLTRGLGEGGGHEEDLGALLEAQPLVQLGEAEVVADGEAEAADWGVDRDQLGTLSRLAVSGRPRARAEGGCVK